MSGSTGTVTWKGTISPKQAFVSVGLESLPLIKPEERADTPSKRVSPGSGGEKHSGPVTGSFPPWGPFPQGPGLQGRSFLWSGAPAQATTARGEDTKGPSVPSLCLQLHESPGARLIHLLTSGISALWADPGRLPRHGGGRGRRRPCPWGTYSREEHL